MNLEGLDEMTVEDNVEPRDSNPKEREGTGSVSNASAGSLESETE